MTPNAVTLLPGGENIKSVYQRILQSTKADFVCLSTGYQAVIGDWYSDTFAPQMFKGSIRTREIIADNAQNRAYGKDKDARKNQVRYLKNAAETDLILCDDFVALVSFNPGNPYAVVLEDIAVISSVRVWFETMWQSAAR